MLEIEKQIKFTTKMMFNVEEFDLDALLAYMKFEGKLFNDFLNFFYASAYNKKAPF